MSALERIDVAVIRAVDAGHIIEVGEVGGKPKPVRCYELGPTEKRSRGTAGIHTPRIVSESQSRAVFQFKSDFPARS